MLRKKNHHLSSSSRKKGKKRKWLFTLLLLCSGAILFKNYIACLAIHAYVSLVLPKQSEHPITYRTCYQEKDHLFIEGLKIEQDGGYVEIERVEVQCKIDLKQKQISPYIYVTDPHIIATDKKYFSSSSQIGAWLIPTKHYVPVVEVKGGVVEFPTGSSLESLYFVLSPEAGSSKLSIGLDPGMASLLVSAEVKASAVGLDVSVDVHPSDLSYCKSLLYAAVPSFPSQWEMLDGKLQSKVDLVLGPKVDVVSLSCLVEISNAHVASDALGFYVEADMLQGHFSYPPSSSLDVNPFEEALSAPFWKQAEACILLKKGAMVVTREESTFGAQNIDMELTLLPHEDPSLKMQGQFVYGSMQRPFEIEGKGFVEKDGKFWLQTHATMPSIGSYDKMHVLGSLCTLEKQKLLLQLDMQNVAADFFMVIEPMLHASPLEPLSVDSGVVSANVSMTLEDLKCQNIEWSDAIGRNLHVHLTGGAEKLDFSFVDIRSKGALEKNQGAWTIKHMDVECAESALRHREKYIQLSSHLTIEDNLLMPSQLNLSYKGAHASIATNPVQDLNVLRLTFNGAQQELCELFCRGDLGSKDSISLVADLIKEENQLMLEASAEIAHGTRSVDRIQCGLEIPAMYSDIYSIKGIVGALCHYKGWVKADKIKEETYSPLFTSFYPDMTLSGEVSLYGILDAKEGNLYFQTQNITLSHPRFLLHTGLVGKSDPSLVDAQGWAHLAYHREKKDFSLALPLQEASFLLTNENICIDQMKAKVVVSKDKIESDHLVMSAYGQTLALKGHWTQDEFYLETKACSGQLEHLAYAASQIPQLKSYNLPVKGEFFIEEEGAALFISKKDSSFSYSGRIKAHVQQVDYTPAKNIRLFNVALDLSLDTSVGFKVGNVKGLCQAGEELFDFKMKECAFSHDQSSPFAFDIYQHDKLFAHLQGKIAQGTNINVSFDPESSYIEKIPLLNTSFIFDTKLSLLSFHAAPKLSTADLFSLAKIASKMQLTSSQINSDSVLSHLHGNLDAILLYEKDKASFEIKLTSPSLSYDKTSLGPSELLIKKEKDLWVVDHLSCDALLLKTAFSEKDGLWSAPYFVFKTKEVSAQGQLVYDQKTYELHFPSAQMELVINEDLIDLAYLHKANVRINAKGSIHLSSDYQLQDVQGVAAMRMSLLDGCEFVTEKAVECSYLQDRILLNNLSLHLLEKEGNELLAKAKVKTLFFSPLTKECSIHQLSANMFPRALDLLVENEVIPESLAAMKLDRTWSVQGDISLNEAGVEGMLSFGDGVYSILGQEIYVKQPKLQLKSESFYVQAKTELNKQPLYVEMQKDFSALAPIYLRLKDDTNAPGLRLVLNPEDTSYYAERIEGALMGSEIDLRLIAKGKSYIYDGSFKPHFTKLSSLLSQEWKKTIQKLNLDSGYELTGRFTVGGEEEKFHFVGDLIGTEFDLLGYRFDSLMAKADLSLDKSVLRDVKLHDAAGALSIKECTIAKLNEEEWELFVPLVSIKEFIPAYLAKEGVRDKVDRPFVIKNLGLYDLIGTLGQSHSFQANGSLYFSQSYKKGFSVFDIPFQLIKDIGLDPGILTPVSGEVDFVLEKGKCFFTDLRNSFSEGKRSEFFLSHDEGAPYLDLEGNWHVDLKMRQYVMIKLTESFVLAIRGKINKPKYSLKNVDLFAH